MSPAEDEMQMRSMGKTAYDGFAVAEAVQKSSDFNSNANSLQHGGDHYRNKNIQPWDYIVANDLGFLEGSIIKYITRHREKGGIDDLKKAKHFLDKLIEVEAAKTNT